MGLCEVIVFVRCFEVCKTSKLPLGKDLILLVGSGCLGALIRGLQNLKAPCEGERVVTFCVVQKVTKKHTGLRPATSIQIAGRTVIVAKNNRRSSSNRFCEKLQLRRVSPAMI